MKSFNKLAVILGAAGILFSQTLAAQAVECADNGHFFELVAGGVSWTAAETAAAGMTRNGVSGYLATITSAEENACVAAVAGGTSVWLGGNDIDVEGTWVWITGELFDSYTSWNPGEPNNSGGEDCLHMVSGASANWNDLPCGNTGQGGYVVEYEPGVDISVTGVDANGGAPVVAGSGSNNISYTFTVENLGPDAAGDVVNLLTGAFSALPGFGCGLSVSEGSLGATTIPPQTAWAFSWNGLNLGPGDSAELYVDCTAPASTAHGKVFTSVLALDSIGSGIDTGSSSKSATLESTVIREAIVNVTKTWGDTGSGEVDVMLTCNDAVVDTATTSGLAASFTLTDFDDVTNCFVTEVVPAGFAPTYTGCSAEPVTSGMTYECGIANSVSNATFAVTKEFSDGNTDPVTVTLICNGGLPLQQSFEISDGNPVTFTVTNFIDGAVDCEVTEEGTAGGYTPSFDNGVDPVSETSCEYMDVTSGAHTCTIFNASDPADYVVAVDWFVGEGGVEEDTYAVEVTVNCQSDIVTVNGSVVSPSTQYVGLIEENFPVTLGVDTTDGDSSCSATQSITQSGVEPEASAGCTNASLTAGDGATCTFSNTVFFEGIPTLSQYGLALMALLMLSVGFVGFRRFV